MWYKYIWSSMWCKDEELEFRKAFRGTKLGEGKLGCAEEPMLGWRNFLGIQLEESWSCMVFILASINLLWRWWHKLEMGFIHRWMLKSLAQGRCAQEKEIEVNALLRLWMIKGTTWDTKEKLKWLKCNLSLILSIGMPYYQEGCITMVFVLVSVLK